MADGDDDGQLDWVRKILVVRLSFRSATNTTDTTRFSNSGTRVFVDEIFVASLVVARLPAKISIRSVLMMTHRIAFVWLFLALFYSLVSIELKDAI